jgi:hypothetical protein
MPLPPFELPDQDAPPDPDAEWDSPGVSAVPTREPEEPSPDVFNPEFGAVAGLTAKQNQS